MQSEIITCKCNIRASPGSADPVYLLTLCFYVGRIGSNIFEDFDMVLLRGRAVEYLFSRALNMDTINDDHNVVNPFSMFLHIAFTCQRTLAEARLS